MCDETRKDQLAPEKREKLERYRRLNAFAQPHRILFAGSSLMEQFPVNELIQDLQLPYTVYNRGIGGYTTQEFLDSMDICVYDLQPDYIYLNIGTNDMNGQLYSESGLICRYRTIIEGIYSHLPDVKLFLMAYYPVNPSSAPDPGMQEVLKWRTNDRIRSANAAVEKLAAETGAAFIDLNESITDPEGELKAEYTVDGMHMYADGYMQVMKALIPYLPLIKAAIRYLPCIIGSVGLAVLFVSVFGKLFGMEVGESVAYIGIPIMGGGMGAGAVPISKVFESALGIPAEQIMSRLVPAVALGNAFAIVCGGLLNRLGQVFPKLTGNGQLVISNDESLKQEEVDIEAKGIGDYALGMVVATCFFAFGSVVAKLIAMLGLDIHPYAWMIIAVAVAKCTGIVPEKYENAAAVWYKFVSGNWTAALMLGIGIAYTDMGQIISALTPTYIVLVATVVIGAILGAGLIGRLVGFYPIEAAITAGLCMANMGGTGDVAVLMASKRMELMPFAQISSRLGGAFIILLASVLVPIFF